jgi:hypothetical protein|tara:strand:+ start:1162 stop:1506 length:345 start_codon:yes stop_codon:yes gene_type:complete
MKGQGKRVDITGTVQTGQHPNMTGYSVRPVSLPIAETGQCKNYKQCKNYTPKPYQQSSLSSSDLANGYCVICWDRGLDSADARLEAKAQKKARGTGKKTRRRSVQMGGSTYMLG